MEHTQVSSIEPIYTSSSQFGVEFENLFVVLDDAKHVIGVDPTDAGKLILENLENGKADRFGWSQSSCYKYITTVVFDGKTGSLYCGNNQHQIHKYKVDTARKSCKKVKDFGDLGMGLIISSHRFIHFIFFGGNWGKIRVLDLSTGEFLPGHLETSIWNIQSLQVCVKSNNQIYLAVSGNEPVYSKNKTDLFDVTGLLPNDPVILQEYLSEPSQNDEDNILEQTSTLKSQEKRVQNMRKEKDLHNPRLSEMILKHSNSKESNEKDMG